MRLSPLQTVLLANIVIDPNLREPAAAYRPEPSLLGPPRLPPLPARTARPREPSPREQAKLAAAEAKRQRRREKRRGEAAAACPCKSDAEEPGPHVPQCPYADDDYSEVFP